MIFSNAQIFGAKIKDFFKDSLYARWFRNNKGLIIICMLISAFLCILTYPGIIYSDSYTRITTASELETVIHAFLNGDSSITNLNSWITVFPSFFILLSTRLVGSIVLYTFIQSLVLWVMTVAFGRTIASGKHIVWIILCILVCPVVWAYGVYYEASVGCVSAILAILLLVFKYDQLECLFDKIFTPILIIFLSIVCFGFRANAFSIIPALIIIVLVKYWQQIKSLIIIASILVGYLLTSLIPKAMNINTMSSFAASFVWETVSCIQIMDADTQAEYSTYLDDILGDGITAKAIETSQFGGQDSYIVPMFTVVSIDEISKPGNASLLMKKYFNMMKSQPKTYLKVKWEFVAHTLGINKSINFMEYDYNRWEQMDIYRFNDSLQRKVFVNYISSYMNYMKLYHRPFFMYAIVLVLLLLKRFAYKEVDEKISLQESAFLVAIFYYGAFVLNTQSFEFRYFFPSWLILFLLTCNLFADLFYRRKYIREALVIASFIVLIRTFKGGYSLYTSLGDVSLSNLQVYGKMLYEDESRKVFYLDNKVYFVVEKGADTEYTYFIHYSSDNGASDGEDFLFKDRKIPTSGTCDLAVVELPNSEISSIGFGQYYNDKRFWESTVVLEDFAIIRE